MSSTLLIRDLILAQADIFLAVSILALLVAGVFLKTRAMQRIAIGAVTVLIVTMIMTLQQDNSGVAVSLFGEMLVYDRFAVFMKVLIILAAIAAIFTGVRDLGGQVIGRFEYIILVLLAVLGMNFMVSADNMLSLYMGLELQSLSLYILAAFNRNSLRSSEAGLKYFILGALSSGILLFGISLVYGFVGSTSFSDIARTLGGMGGAVPMAVIVAMVFVLVGLAFKISAVPFHMWTPDVYEGAPASVTAFFALAPKVAALGLLIRVLYDTFGAVQSEWVQIIWALSALSMVVGAFAGLAQKNIYRLMAYSSIGHIGYVLLGVIGGTTDGLAAALIYTALYIVMTGGFFACLIAVRRDDMALMRIADFAGLSTTSPVIAYIMALLLFSMSGIPPLAGFFGKFFVFAAVLSAGHIWLAVLGVITSVVAAYYYLAIIKVMFFDQASEGVDRQGHSLRLVKWVAYPSVAFTVLYIVFPNWLVHEAQRAALSLY